MAAYVFVQRGKDDVKQIDGKVRNKWNWSWCERELCDGDDVHLVADFIRKVTEPGVAWCDLCKETIRYGSSGFKAIARHASAIGPDKHRAKFKLRRSNYQLTGIKAYNFILNFEVEV